jgi:hypothetical protein|tara:strand:+ start:6048 stop:6443 length:396 start_codon:yes stop_codon:yes gene_type:complete
MENDIKVNMLTSDLKVLEETFEIENIKLIDIFQVVGKRNEQKGYSSLFDNIAENGFKNPIIVIPNNQINYNLALRQVKTEYINPWLCKRWLCVYGNQRIDIALKLGLYELKTIVAPNIEWAYATHLRINEK